MQKHFIISAFFNAILYSIKLITGGGYIKTKPITKNEREKTYEMLINQTNEDEEDDDKLSFKDFEKMMMHDCYKRHKGSIRQVKHG